MCITIINSSIVIILLLLASIILALLVRLLNLDLMVYLIICLMTIAHPIRVHQIPQQHLLAGLPLLGTI